MGHLPQMRLRFSDHAERQKSEIMSRLFEGNTFAKIKRFKNAVVWRASDSVRARMEIDPPARCANSVELTWSSPHLRG